MGMTGQEIALKTLERIHMSNAKSAWGIEVGSFAAKAVRLERQGPKRSRPISRSSRTAGCLTPDVDVDEVVRISLGQFVHQKAVDKTRVASVPGNVAFSALRAFHRTSLPDPELAGSRPTADPVSDRRGRVGLPFSSEDSPEIEVGIFALQRMFSTTGSACTGNSASSRTW